MTNRIGIHALVWVGGWSKEEARLAISSSAEAGYDLIELAALDPWSFDADMTAALLQEHGLAAGVSLGLTDETDVSSEDPDAVAAGNRLLDQALNLVRDVGGDYLGGVIFSKLGSLHRAGQRARPGQLDRVHRPLADRAKEYGITLGIEFTNRYESNVCNTTAQTLDYIEAVGRENVVAHLDTYHMNIEENSFREAVLAAAAAGKLGYVHVGESHRGQLGTGTVPWQEFFAALREVSYDGTITFESFSSEVVHPTLSSSLSIWRNLWVDNAELARGARAFLRDHYGT
jgi:D-psicose/D-tagatose/L-ribulose 3-epimerase